MFPFLFRLLRYEQSLNKEPCKDKEKQLAEQKEQVKQKALENEQKALENERFLKQLQKMAAEIDKRIVIKNRKCYTLKLGDMTFIVLSPIRYAENLKTRHKNVK